MSLGSPFYGGRLRLPSLTPLRRRSGPCGLDGHVGVDDRLLYRNSRNSRRECRETPWVRRRWNLNLEVGDLDGPLFKDNKSKGQNRETMLTGSFTSVILPKSCSIVFWVSRLYFNTVSVTPFVDGGESIPCSLSSVYLTSSRLRL